MTEQVKRPKAKRKLSDISFEHEGAHVALVSKDQGGGANGHNYALVMKSVNFSDEFIQKMQQVKVTMELPDFLQRFFGLWGEDAKVLATMMGYVEPAETSDMEATEAEEDLQDWIKSRMEAFEVIKSLYEAESMPEVLSKLDEYEYLAMLKDQEKLEKAFRKIDKLEKANKPAEKNSAKAEEAKADEGSTEAIAKAEQSGEKTEAKVEPSETVNKGKSMTKEVQVAEKTVEVVEKSQLDSIQKAFDEQKEQLQKALDLVAAFEKEKKEAIRKARFDQLKTAVKDEAKAEVLFKAAGLVEDEVEFQAVVKALADMQALVEKSALFIEQGVQVEADDKVKESAVARVIKARLSK